MAKRKCRMTANELEMHDRAVKFRKMTDEQLCNCIDKSLENAYQQGLSKGANARVISCTICDRKSVEHFLEHLVIPGVGPTTVDKLRKYAKDGGYIGME